VRYDAFFKSLGFKGLMYLNGAPLILVLFSATDAYVWSSGLLLQRSKVERFFSHVTTSISSCNLLHNYFRVIYE